jgi:hypothetical protein
MLVIRIPSALALALYSRVFRVFTYCETVAYTLFMICTCTIPATALDLISLFAQVLVLPSPIEPA